MLLPGAAPLEGMGCALAEIHGRVSPLPNGPLFLCGDFIEDSLIGGDSPRLLPVLRQLKFTVDADGDDRGYIDVRYDKMLYLPANRSPVSEMLLYIADAGGDLVPLSDCELHCTIICVNW